MNFNQVIANSNAVLKSTFNGQEPLTWKLVTERSLMVVCKDSTRLTIDPITGIIAAESVWGESVNDEVTIFSTCGEKITFDVDELKGRILEELVNLVIVNKSNDDAILGHIKNLLSFLGRYHANYRSTVCDELYRIVYYIPRLLPHLDDIFKNPSVNKINIEQDTKCIAEMYERGAGIDTRLINAAIEDYYADDISILRKMLKQTLTGPTPATNKQSKLPKRVTGATRAKNLSDIMNEIIVEMDHSSNYCNEGMYRYDKYLSIPKTKLITILEKFKGKVI